MFGTTTGPCNPEWTDESPAKNPDDSSSGSNSLPKREREPEQNGDRARCACGDYADGYDARREEPVCDDCARLITDGGEEIDDALEYDPRSFRDYMTPAVVRERLGDGETAKVSFAEVNLRESGALFWRTWDGESGLLPEWRWTEVSFIETERITDEHGAPTGGQQVAEHDWSRLPDNVREAIEPPKEAVEA
jgi:hypothetical protein